MLELVFNNETQSNWNEDFFRGIFEHSLKTLNLNDKTSELGLYLVNPDKSQELNREHRSKDKPTDVLSFPIEDNILKKHDILPLGDIFICVEVAERQAKEENIPISQEMARLAVHGLLHLLGYDHELSEKDEHDMIELQENILKELKF